MLVGELERLATDDQRVTTIARQAGVPLTVAVHGRPGVGRRSVARALGAAGLRVAADPAGGRTADVDPAGGRTADVDVFVVAEVVKPEDRAAIRESMRPRLVVLNKADLSGPIATARQRCAHYRRLTGVPTVPMVAHLAVAEVDDELIGALRQLASGPMGSAVPGRLLETLDRFGIARAVAVLRERPAADAAAVRSALRRHSLIGGVLEALAAPVAEARYLRLRAAMTALEALAITADEPLAGRIDAFLGHDDTVAARMAAAVELIEAAGLTADPADSAGTGSRAWLRRAVHWQRYARGPLGAMYRCCAADIARGSLRARQRPQRQTRRLNPVT